jgi:uncharacterized damage-inducible protein DinB
MIRSIADFASMWKTEFEATQKIFKSLTTESLTQTVHSDVRSLGRSAWHIVTSIPEMAGRTGLKLAGPHHDAPIPATAEELVQAYCIVGSSILETVKSSWSDKDLLVEDDMYGEKWARGTTLEVLITHQIHHRAQMIVVMRILGLRVPGIYGPTKEEWSSYGMPAPTI